MFGPLIVKQSVAREPHRHLYDEDLHVFTVSVFGSAILVNGRDVHEVSGQGNAIPLNAEPRPGERGGGG